MQDTQHPTEHLASPIHRIVTGDSEAAFSECSPSVAGPRTQGPEGKAAIKSMWAQDVVLITAAACCPGLLAESLEFDGDVLQCCSASSPPEPLKTCPGLRKERRYSTMLLGGAALHVIFPCL